MGIFAFNAMVVIVTVMMMAPMVPMMLSMRFWHDGLLFSGFAV